MMARRYGTIIVHCESCHRDRRIDCRRCEIVLHPAGTALLSWTCTRCGAQTLTLPETHTVDTLQHLGVPVADWRGIDPWMDRPHDRTPITVGDVQTVIETLGDPDRFAAALRTLTEGQP
jgi:hypothetical protein